MQYYGKLEWSFSEVYHRQTALYRKSHKVRVDVYMEIVLPWVQVIYSKLLGKRRTNMNNLLISFLVWKLSCGNPIVSSIEKFYVNVAKVMLNWSSKLWLASATLTLGVHKYLQYLYKLCMLSFVAMIRFLPQMKKQIIRSETCLYI